MSSASKPAVSIEKPVRALADLDLARDRVGLALFVECHHDDRRPVPADAPGVLEERALSFLQRQRVDDALALQALETRLEHRPAGAVDHDRQPRRLRLGREKVEEAGHDLLAVEQVGVHVHVESVRPASHLLERDLDGLLEIAGLDERAKARRPGDVRPLADHHEAGVRPDLERLEPAPPGRRCPGGDAARRDRLDGGGDLADVLGCGAAAAPDDVHEPVLRECAQVTARVARLLVVLAHRVRQPRVRVARDIRVGHPGEALQERAHLGRAERAVDARDQRPCVLDRHPERLRGLPREVPAAPVDRREREPQRQVGRHLARGDDRRLRVQRVEDRLDQEEIDATLGERRDLLCVCRAHLVERHGAKRGVVDLRGDGEGDVQRAECARDEPGTLRRPPRPLVGGGTRESRASERHLRGQTLERVVPLADARRGERVRRGQVCAGREVRVVDLGDDVRLREVQQVRVALHVTRVIAEQLAAILRLRQPAAVDEHPPRPVVHDDSAVEDLPQLIDRAHSSPRRPPCA